MLLITFITRVALSEKNDLFSLSMQRGPWEANRRSLSQEFPSVFPEIGGSLTCSQQLAGGLTY